MPSHSWLYEMKFKKYIQRIHFLKVEIYNVFYTDRNLHGLIFSRFILIPIFEKTYHEVAPYSDAYIYGHSQ